ncbi:MAG: hypothetical protein KKD65_12855 [Gammaproteobacteria bacterium]|nr:hypothetical protein [Gammaproteobacteria bacterium]
MFISGKKEQQLMNKYTKSLDGIQSAHLTLINLVGVRFLIESFNKAEKVGIHFYESPREEAARIQNEYKSHFYNLILLLTEFVNECGYDMRGVLAVDEYGDCYSVGFKDKEATS